METAYHAARMVAVQSALLSLLSEQEGDNLHPVDGVTASLGRDADGITLDIVYTVKGQPVAGEGM